MQQHQPQSRKQLLEELEELRYQLDLARSRARQYQDEYKKMAYVVSHDLRSPLINLKGFSAELRFSLAEIEPLLERALPRLDESERETLSRALEADIPESLHFIESAVQQIDEFLGAVLCLSRMTRRTLKLEPLDMTEMVQQTWDGLMEEYPDRAIDFSVDSLPQVVADKESMEDVWQELLENSVLYLSPERPGEIQVTAERRPADEVIAFHVRDNGRGIAEADMHKVFEPFRRAGKPTVDGLGMGLAYVQALARLHGGTLECTSEIDRGSTFTFTIADR